MNECFIAEKHLASFQFQSLVRHMTISQTLNLFIDQREVRGSFCGSGFNTWGQVGAGLQWPFIRGWEGPGPQSLGSALSSRRRVKLRPRKVVSHLGPQSGGLLWDISQLWTVSEPHCTWGQTVNAGRYLALG